MYYYNNNKNNNNLSFYQNYKCIKDENNLIISFCIECNEPLSLKSITSNVHRGHTFKDIEEVMKFETLFWKVFKNRLLRNNIFLMMEQTPLHKRSLRSILQQQQIITSNPYYFTRIKFKNIRSLGFMVKRKLWKLLEIKLKADEYILIKARDLYLFLEINRDVNLISLLYEKKKEQLKMFDLIECAYTLDNQEALEYFLSMSVPTNLSSYMLINNNNNNNNNNNGFLISSIKSLELLLKYKVNLIDNSNNNSNNWNISPSSSFLSPSNSMNCLIRSASSSSISSNSSNDSYGNNSFNNSNNNNNNNNSYGGIVNSIPPPPSYRQYLQTYKENNNKQLKNTQSNYLLSHFRLLNMGNINESIEKFQNSPSEYSKITYEIIKKCLKYSNLKDLETLFKSISKYSPGIPFDRFSQSVLCGRPDVYSLIIKIFPEFFNQLSFNQSIRQTIQRGDLEMLQFLIETFSTIMEIKDLKSELIELSIKNNQPLILKYLLKNIK